MVQPPFQVRLVIGAQPRAHGGVGLAVVEILAAAQEALEQRATMIG